MCIRDSGSEVNISGGTVGRSFLAESGSEVNLLGSEFFLDGELLDTLIFDEPFTISDRDVTLSGTLEDGSLFSFGLNSSFVSSEDLFELGATLTVTLVETLALAGDFNGDGFVGQADLDLVLLNFGEQTLPTGFNTAALPGGTFDDLIGQNELDAVLLNFGEGSAVSSAAVTAVPEPASAALVALGGIALLTRRRRDAA